MPALLQALKISEKAVAQGFEWPKEEDVWSQLDSELKEFREAVRAANEKKQNGEQPDTEELDLEMGDVIFTLVNIGRWHGLNAEESLLLALEKFRKRFSKMEQMASMPLKELSLNEWESLWQAAKKAAD
jgi:uncharacterized protein YabN with tetrapyrrole methylase and pyrophosphatase domain